MLNVKFTFFLSVIFFLLPPVYAKQVIHDAEYYVLEAQHGEQWTKQDKELDKMRGVHDGLLLITRISLIPRPARAKL